MTVIARRTFLQSAAGLVVAFSLPQVAEASPATLEADSVDAYLVIAPDSSVTVYAGKVDLGTGARAAIRQIVERRTRELQDDFQNGTRQVVTAVEYAEAMMTKGFFTLADPNTVVEPMEALAAAQVFQRLTKDMETEANVASLLQQLDTILKVIKDVVPEPLQQLIAARLRGEQLPAGSLTGRVVQDADVVPEEDFVDIPDDGDDDL